MKMFSMAVDGVMHRQLAEHLLRKDQQEDLCFATYSPSQGNTRFSALITSVILPEKNERHVHGNVSFSSSYVERALQVAALRGEGIAFLHSHPGGSGWQFMSRDDINAETRLSLGAMAVTGLPLLGMTLAGDDETWSARFWIKHPEKRRCYEMKWCETVRVVGDRFSISYYPRQMALDRERLMRTISAWGEKTQYDLSQMTIGIVGLGSVGSMVAEMLARKGLTRFVLIDFDRVETKNLDRLMNVFASDVGEQKVDAVSRGMQCSKSSETISVRKVPYSVCEEEGYRAALDCDVIFSCVDRPWPREVLNVIAYAHMIPVIDGGIKVMTNTTNTAMKGADWKVQTVGPNRPCLEQWGQYTTALARLERDGFLDDPDYIEGMADKSVVEAKENVFAFSANLASLEVMQLLNMVVAPSGEAVIGQQTYHLKNGTMDVIRGNPFNYTSFCQKLTGKGDLMGFAIYGRHLVAENSRK